MDQLDVKSVEMSFVTSIDETNQTFFAQFCKFSLDDLFAFNDQVNKICNEIHPKKGSPEDVKVGDSYCCKFPVDGRWYRGNILGVDAKGGKCTVLYTDYGNSDTVSYSDLVVIDPTVLPEIKRPPFGITCSLSNSKGERSENLARMLKVLRNNYVMFKVLGRRKEEPIWDVEVARHAYNMTVWLEYKPSLLKDRTWRSGHWKIVHG